MHDSSVDVLMITHNRAQYTARSLQTLFDHAEHDTRVWIWQNGQDEETVKVVRSFEGQPNLFRIHFSPQNERLTAPTNWVLAEGEAAYFAKVDDDCLVSPGWIPRLREALDTWPELGVAACWHFQESELDLTLAAKKLHRLSDDISILQNNWVQGSGVMIKRECISAAGLITELNSGITPYYEKVRKAGWKLGWVVPAVLIEHMDDPTSEFCRFKTEAEFQKSLPLSADVAGVRSLAEWKERMKWMARIVQTTPAGDGIDARFTRLQRRVSRKLQTVFGIDPPWRKSAKRLRR